MTSAIAAAKYCKENYNGATVMMIGEKGLEEALAFGRDQDDSDESRCGYHGD